MPMSEVMVQVRFGGVDQRSSTKLIQVPGRLIEGLNVWQKETGTYSKRDGFGVLDRTTDTGSITAGMGLVNAGQIVQHADDQLWHRDTTASKWRSRGLQQRAFPEDNVAIPGAAGRCQLVIASGYAYYFTRVLAVAGGVRSFIYRIVDVATGIEIQPATTIVEEASSGLDARIKAVVGGGFVWLFYQSGAGVLNTAKFDPANPGTAPVTATFWAASVSGIWDVTATTTTPIVMDVNATSVTVGGAAGQIHMAYLDTATGGVKASPGTVGFAAPSSPLTTPGGWITYDGTNGFLYLVFNAGVSSNTYLTRVTATTLANTTRALTTGLNFNDRHWGGYSTDGDTVQVLVSDCSNGSTAASIENAKIHKYQHVWSTNTSTITANWVRQAWQACEPAKVGSTWYLITGHDDTGGTTGNVQRSYCLRLASTGQILARALFGRGGNSFQRGNDTVASGSFSQATPALAVTGTDIWTCLVANDGVDGEYHTRRVVWKTADTYGPLAAIMESHVALMPGGWPVRIGDYGSALNEVVPMMWPRTFTISTTALSGGTLTSANFTTTHMYVLKDGRGNLYRSNTCAAQTIGGAPNFAIRSVVPSLRQTIAGATAFIETYMSAAGTTSPLYLVKTTANDPTADTITIDVSTPPTSGAEVIYTSGGVLVNTPPPPFRLAQTWHNRVILADTDVEGEAWISKELQVGFGPGFSGISSLSLTDGTGRIRAMAPVDDNFFAFFKSDALFVLEGTLPNDLGQGDYRTRTLPYSNGCTNPNSVVTMPLGCMYQAVDGTIQLVNRSLDVAPVGRGVADYQTSTVTAAVHDSKNQLVLFFTSGAKVLVFDYQNPVTPASYPEEGLGQWYVWSVPVAAVAATIVNGVVHYVDATGVVWKQVASQYFDNVSTPILHATETAPISFAGILGYGMAMRGQILGTVSGTSTVKITSNGDFNLTTENWSKALTAGQLAVEFRPSTTRKCTALGVRIEQTGSDLTAGFTMEGLAFDVAVETAIRRLNTSQRV